MLERRSLLTGLAALPTAGLPLAAMATATQSDPFTGYSDAILALHEAIATDPGESAADRLIDRWGEIDRMALAGCPTTLAGAAGALRYARREFVQFSMEDNETADNPSHRLILHLVDGAIAVLRQAACGGVA